MALWFAALLGLVQGLTEYIPISSTAHLRILPALFGQPDKWGAEYTAVIQLGTLAAVVVYFARDLWTDASAMFRDPSSPEGKMPYLLAVGTVPIVVAGLLLKKHVEGDLRSLYVVCASLVIIGIAMWVIDGQAQNRSETRALATFTFTDAIAVGLAQTLALVPGVSRSGSTICMALAIGLARPEAARFSFLLGIPAIAGAGILELKPAVAALRGAPITPIVVATVIAAISSYASIAWLIRWLGTHHLTPFAAYRVLVGIAIAALVLAGVIAP